MQDILKMVHPNADKGGLTRMNDLVYPKVGGIYSVRRACLSTNQHSSL